MIKIILGLIGLCFVVIIHEFGHFVVARICGVTVESFSIGWGPVLLRKKKGATEYRISAIPLGGYCGMKGDKDFQTSFDQHKKTIEAEPDSFYGVSPLARMAISFAGPFFNLLFAILAMICIQGIGYTTESYRNKIVLASEYDFTAESPADIAGLKSGDIITAINNKEIDSYADIQQEIGTRPNTELVLTVNRNGTIQSIPITPELDTATGIGRIGIYPWIDVQIRNIKENSAAFLAGLKENDIITAVNTVPVRHVIEFQHEMEKYKTAEPVLLQIQRGETGLTVSYIPQFTDNNEHSFGMGWNYDTYTVQSDSFFAAIADGFTAAVDMVRVAVKSIGLLFQGIDIKKAVSGPVRITYMLGDIAESSFAAGFKDGIVAVLNFLSLISISLFLMNLLPIPVLDGGIIFMAIWQLLFARKGLHPRMLYYFQIAGVIFIAALVIFAFFNDISFFVRKGQ